jgi:thiol-disulfide isomerase/thioredoxin
VKFDFGVLWAAHPNPHEWSDGMRVTHARHRVFLTNRNLVLGFLVFVIIAFSTLTPLKRTSWTTKGITATRTDDEAYDEEFQKGLDLLRRGKFEDALKSFRGANEMRGKKSPECFYGMAQAFLGMEAYKNVIDSCDKVIEFSGNDIQLQAQAYNLKGLAIRSQSAGKDQKKLREAEAALRQGLMLNAGISVQHFNLGIVLMQQNRDPDGISELQKYLEFEPDGNFADTARKLIANPRRAREPYAPDFSITTSEGEYLELEELRGKVVVLDFWGTWCPPCVESLPSLRSLHKRYSKEPSFVMIGISSDNEEETWRDFTVTQKMAWPQYLDRDRRIQRAFSVRAFPTYIVIDHEGIVRFRTSGTSWERSAYLDDAIRKQVKIVAKATTAN